MCGLWRVAVAICAPRMPSVIPSNVAELGRNLTELIERRAAERGDATFLVWDPEHGARPDAIRSVSYAGWAANVAWLAAALAARGVGRGDKVCVHLDNRPEAVLAWWALARLGAVCVSTNARSAADELRFYLEDSEAVAIVTSAARRDVVADALPPAVKLVVLVDDDAAPIEREGGRCEILGELVAEGASLAALPPSPAEPLDPCSILYTSGTTSRPKGVVLTHANYLWGAGQMCLHQKLTPDDVYLVQMPLFHVNAQIYSVLAAWVAGAKVALVPGFSRSGFWRAAAHHGATTSSMIPFFVMALLRNADGQRIARDELPEHAFRLWGYGISSGKVDARFRLKTLGWYGMTETVSAAVIGSWDGAAPEGAIGRPAPGYQVRLLDDEGIPVPPTVPGAVYVRGERGVSLALEYHNRPRATAAAFSRDGWFATGDRMRYDEEGWLYFVDREKDMLKVGGENVASSEIERVIQEVPGVLEVAVVGLADALLDEVPVACVIAAPGTDAEPFRERILAHARGKLADFKVPRRIELVDALPRATLEKVNKAALRASLSERAGG